MMVARARMERITGAVLAAAVQACLLALLILSREATAPRQIIGSELTFILPRLQPAPALPAATPSGTRAAPPRPILVTPPRVMQTPSLPAAPQAPSAEDLRNFGQSIWGCAPETWSSLTPAERARCPRPGEGFTAKAAPDLNPPSQSKDSDHWAAELASRKSIRVPCTNLETEALGPTKNATTLMVDPICGAQELGELFKKLRR